MTSKAPSPTIQAVAGSANDKSCMTTTLAMMMPMLVACGFGRMELNESHVNEFLCHKAQARCSSAARCQNKQHTRVWK